MIHRLRILFGCVLLLIPRQAWAQLGCAGATCTVEVSMPIVDVLRLSVSASSVSLGAPTDADYQAGYKDVMPVSVTVSANRPVMVQVTGLASLFSYSGSMANPGKPASQLLWATSAAGLSSTTNHMGTLLTFVSQNAGSAVIPLYLRTLWSYAIDVPGTYSLGISFTLSAP
jgi:hypothetical protein